MAFTSTEVRKDYQGDGGTVTFAIPARGAIVSSSVEVQVWLRNEAVTPATEAQKSLTTHYTISGSNVVMVTAPALTEKLIIKLVLANTQTLTLIDNATIVPTQIMTALDRIAAQVQQLEERVDRSICFSETEQFVGQPQVEPGDTGDGVVVFGLTEDRDEVVLYTPDELFDLAEGTLSVQVANSFTNGQALTNLSGVTLNSANWTSGWLLAEIVRDTTTVHRAALGLWRVQFANSAWEVEESLQSTAAAHGVTLGGESLSAAILQIQLASSTLGGASHVGSIKIKFLRFAA